MIMLLPRRSKRWGALGEDVLRELSHIIREVEGQSHKGICLIHSASAKLSLIISS